MNNKEISKLRSQAHHLKPVIMIGANGYTEAVSSEIDQALNNHELIKIKILQAERSERSTLATRICEEHEATLIQTMGRIVTIYRLSKED